MTESRTTVGILIFEDVEVLDFCGPFEALSVATRLGEHEDDAKLFDVRIIAESTDVVSCRNGLQVVPHHAIAAHPPLDILVIPGGRGTRRERTNPAILDWLAQHSSTASITSSVCTGAFLLAAVGLLDGKSATTHWGSIDWLREHHPEIIVRDDLRWIDEGSIVTSAGVSAGIDMALHLVDRLHGRAVAEQTARHMEYVWNPGNQAES